MTNFESDRKADVQLPKLVVLISGRGSNMTAIANACLSGELTAKISLVISNEPDAPGLAVAQSLGLETKVVDHRHFSQRADFDHALHLILEKTKPDWIVMAGFMRILGTKLVDTWQGRIINIHPSLLPLYPGLDTHARAIAAGDQEAGATVHLVTPELDAGPVVAQARVPVLKDDTPQTLAKRVLQVEHSLYINALKQCVTGDDTVARLQ